MLASLYSFYHSQYDSTSTVRSSTRRTFSPDSCKFSTPLILYLPFKHAVAVSIRSLFAAARIKHQHMSCWSFRFSRCYYTLLRIHLLRHHFHIFLTRAFPPDLRLITYSITSRSFLRSALCSETLFGGSGKTAAVPGRKYENPHPDIDNAAPLVTPKQTSAQIYISSNPCGLHSLYSEGKGGAELNTYRMISLVDAIAETPTHPARLHSSWSQVHTKTPLEKAFYLSPLLFLLLHCYITYVDNRQMVRPSFLSYNIRSKSLGHRDQTFFAFSRHLLLAIRSI